MSRGIGVLGQRAATTALAASALVACFMPVTLVPARAAEPGAAGAANRYNETEMLEAARRAAQGGERTTVNIGVPPADELRVLEARRDAELKRLSDKLKRAAQARGPKPAEDLVAPSWTTEVTTAAPVPGLDEAQRSALGVRPDAGGPGLIANDPALRGRATVLMVMTPSESRSPNPERAADPILCVADGCYVSSGAQAPAVFLSFGQSMGLAGRIGRGAGACNHSRVCVFRNVDVGLATAPVQPVDLKLVRHDRRELREVKIDTSCKVISGHLSCSRPVRTASYTLWIVPEQVAREIGPEMLSGAVETGLQTASSAGLPWGRQE